MCKSSANAGANNVCIPVPQTWTHSTFKIHYHSFMTICVPLTSPHLFTEMIDCILQQQHFFGYCSIYYSVQIQLPLSSLQAIFIKCMLTCIMESLSLLTFYTYILPSSLNYLSSTLCFLSVFLSLQIFGKVLIFFLNIYLLMLNFIWSFIDAWKC